MRRVLDRRDGRTTQRARTLRSLLGGAAIVAACASLTACGRSEGYKSTNFDVAAEIVTTNGDPVPGVQVQLWIVDVDLPAAQRTPIALSPVQTTNSEGLAVWTYQSVAEPEICGFQVKRATGEVLLDEQPDLRNDFGPTPSRVILSVDL